jgi:hypothetical protein
MDEKNRTEGRRLALPGAPGAEPVTAADGAAAEQNLALFDRLDFEAWNNRDWDLFRELHAEDVHVSGYGATTNGIDEHVGWAEALLAQVPDAKIIGHPIRIGAGDWTAVVGVNGDGSMAATIARWEGGRIAEEYLFSLMAGAGDAGSGTPTS